MEIRTVDEYIALFPEDIQDIMIQTRNAIHAVSPDLKEKISWGMPTFYKNGNIIHFAANKHHLGIYPGAEAMEAFKERLSEYKSSKGAVQFPYKKPVPYELIKEMVLFNLAKK